MAHHHSNTHRVSTVEVGMAVGRVREVGQPQLQQGGATCLPLQHQLFLTEPQSQQLRPCLDGAGWGQGKGQDSPTTSNTPTHTPNSPWTRLTLPYTCPAPTQPHSPPPATLLHTTVSPPMFTGAPPPPTPPWIKLIPPNDPGAIPTHGLCQQHSCLQHLWVLG